MYGSEYDRCIMTMTWENTKLDKDNEAWEKARVENFVLPGAPTPAHLFSRIAMRAAEISKELKETL